VDLRDAFVLAQSRRANVLQDSPGFAAVIAFTNGTMARLAPAPAAAWHAKPFTILYAWPVHP